MILVSAKCWELLFLRVSPSSLEVYGANHCDPFFVDKEAQVLRYLVPYKKQNESSTYTWCTLGYQVLVINL